MISLLLVCFVGYFVTVSNAGPVSSFIDPCKADDEPCIIKSAQKALPYFADGLPDLGVPSLDPLVLDDVKGEEGELQVQFKSLKVARTRECEFTKLAVGADQTHFDLDMHCPITATGQYKVAGKLLFVPIDGEGDCEVKTEKIKISLRAHMETKGDHWHIADLTYTYEPEEQIYFRLDNLFGGDEEKAKPALEILNHSWKEVILTVGKPIIKEIVHKAKDHINTFLSAVTIKDIFIA